MNTIDECMEMLNYNIDYVEWDGDGVIETLANIQQDAVSACATGPWQDGEPSVNYQSTYLLEFEENDEHDSYIRMGTWSYGDNPRLVDLDNRCPFEDRVKRHAPINLPED